MKIIKNRLLILCFTLLAGIVTAAVPQITDGSWANDSLRLEVRGSQLVVEKGSDTLVTQIDSVGGMLVDDTNSEYHRARLKLLNDNELQLSVAGGDIVLSRVIPTTVTSDVSATTPTTGGLVPREPVGFNFTSLMRGILGMVVLLLICWLFSMNRRKISWRVVGIGLGIQIVMAILILKVPFVAAIFEFLGKIFVKILNFSGAGAAFLLGDLLDQNTYGYIFAFQILPTIIFFSALTSVLFYLGIIQKVVYALAWLMTKALKISGAESLSVAGNIFLGQTEAPLMIKVYLSKMNKSEILLVMVGGMATVAGGVLAAYIGFLGGNDPVMRLEFAKHLLAASVMAAPGAIVVSKILCPQTEPIEKNVQVSRDKVGTNILDAMANGTTEGLKLAANVAAMLLVFVAFIAMFNYVCYKIGDWTSLNAVIAKATGGNFDKLSLEFILGYIFAPLMWLIGVCPHDMAYVGSLMGEKLIMSEFVGYTQLAAFKAQGLFLEQKSILIATYMLCGFANFASIGIQIGGIGSLAPNQRTLLSKFGMRALLGGMVASLLSASIVGVIVG